MATCHLLKLPFEILIMVFENCDDFIQVTSLASACKQTNSVWKSSQWSIMSSVAFKCIAALDEALVAARATEIAKVAILDHRLPPKDIDVADLKRFYLRGLDLNRIYHWDTTGNEPGPEEWAVSCRVYFHRAVYRVLLAGPVLAGSYLEPFAYEGVLHPEMRTAPGGSEPMFPPDMPTKMHAKNWHHNPQEDGVAEYLERFPAFDQSANTTIGKRQDDIFRRLAAWLVESMKSNIAAEDLRWAETNPRPRIRSSPHRELDLRGFCGGSPEQGIATLREVMRMLVAYENLSAAITNFDGSERHFRVEEYIHDGQVATAIMEPDGSRTVFAVILGVHQLEKFHVSHTDSWPTERLIATPARYPAEDSSRLPSECDVFQTLAFLHALSGRINHINGSATPPPQFQLFRFILDRFFGMQFQEGYLWSEEGYRDFFGIVFNASLFTNAPTAPIHANPCEILDHRSQSPVYTFDQVL